MSTVDSITNFKECVAQGNPVMESYPRQCRDEEGNLFVENVGNELSKQDLIRVSSPRPNQPISSPLTIIGEARGYWFFEGSFPIVLTDWDGKIISEHYATAQGDWMTEALVPFTATLNFEAPLFGERGTLILKKDNPSGLPKNDDALEIPILFEKGAKKEGVPIQAQYDSKIVYGSGSEVSEEKSRQHCELLGGEFNACGSPCAPNAEACATVCAYTCELK